MADWDSLVALALLGTDQQKSPQLSADGALGELLRKIESSEGKSREAVLLCAAGTISLHTKAGQLPETVAPAQLSPAPEEDLPLCSSVASSTIDLLLESYSETLLPVWLTAVSDAGRRVPEFAAAALLNHAVTKVGLRDMVAKAIGHRGRWLAKQNPEWSFAAGEISALDVKALVDAFEIGDTAERSAALKALRKVEPDKARELVQSTWKTDTHDLRAHFVELLKPNLSMADEPFLEETALEDKRKEVRSAAATLLATIPESRFQARMLERAKPLITFAGGFLGMGKKIEVTLPDSVDAAMIRDGLTKAAPPVDNARRQGWFVEIVGTISPKYWETAFKLSPEALIKEAPMVLREALAQAASLHHDVDWLTELCASGALKHRVPEIISAATPADRERIILRMIERNGNLLHLPNSDYDQPILAALLAANHNWSIEFGRKLIQPLHAQTSNGVTWYTSQLFGTIGLYFPAALLPTMDNTFAVLQNENTEAINKFLGALKFKSDLFGDIK